MRRAKRRGSCQDGPGVHASPAARHSQLAGESGSRRARRRESRSQLKRSDGPARHETRDRRQPVCIDNASVSSTRRAPYYRRGASKPASRAASRLTRHNHHAPVVSTIRKRASPESIFSYASVACSNGRVSIIGRIPVRADDVIPFWGKAKAGKRTTGVEPATFGLGSRSRASDSRVYGRLVSLTMP